MAFIPIDDSEIEVGNPVVKELWDKTQDNFNDHEDRIIALESLAGKIILHNEAWIGVAQLAGGIADHIASFEAPQDLTIVTAKIRQFTAGSSGITELDVRVGNSEPTAASIFSVTPKLIPANGNNAQSGGTILNGAMAQGQIGIIDLSQIQVNTGKIQITIIGEPA